MFGVWYLAASAIGFAVGATNGFLLNRRWTFSEHVGDSLTPVRWATVQCGGLGINEGLLYVFVHDVAIDKLLAQAAATVVVTVSTFRSTARGPFAPIRRRRLSSERVESPRCKTGPVERYWKTVSRESPAGMRPPCPMTAASSVSGRSSSQLAGRGEPIDRDWTRWSWS